MTAITKFFHGSSSSSVSKKTEAQQPKSAEISVAEQKMIESVRQLLKSGAPLDAGMLAKFLSSPLIFNEAINIGKPKTYKRSNNGDEEFTCFHVINNISESKNKHFMTRIGSFDSPLTTNYPLMMIVCDEKTKKQYNDCEIPMDVDSIIATSGVNGLIYNIPWSAVVRANNNEGIFKLGKVFDEVTIKGLMTHFNKTREEAVAAYIPVVRPEHPTGLTTKQKSDRVYPDPSVSPIDYSSFGILKIRLNFYDESIPRKGRKTGIIATYQTSVVKFTHMDDKGVPQFENGSWRDLINTTARTKKDKFSLSYFMDVAFTQIDTTNSGRYRPTLEVVKIWIVPKKISDGFNADDLPDYIDPETAMLSVVRNLLNDTTPDDVCQMHPEFRQYVEMVVKQKEATLLITDKKDDDNNNDDAAAATNEKEDDKNEEENEDGVENDDLETQDLGRENTKKRKADDMLPTEGEATHEPSPKKKASE